MQPSRLLSRQQDDARQHATPSMAPRRPCSSFSTAVDLVVVGTRPGAEASPGYSTSQYPDLDLPGRDRSLRPPGRRDSRSTHRVGAP